MRKNMDFNTGWMFTKTGRQPEPVTLPHTWNAKDGQDSGEVVNWFDREDEIVKEGYFSIKDPMGDIKAHAQAAAAYGDVAKNVQIPEAMQKMMDRMSVEASLRQMGKLVSPEFVHKLNAALNLIRKD